MKETKKRKSRNASLRLLTFRDDLEQEKTLLLLYLLVICRYELTTGIKNMTGHKGARVSSMTAWRVKEVRLQGMCANAKRLGKLTMLRQSLLSNA